MITDSAAATNDDHKLASALPEIVALVVVNDDVFEVVVLLVVVFEVVGVVLLVVVFFGVVVLVVDVVVLMLRFIFAPVTVVDEPAVTVTTGRG